VVVRLTPLEDDMVTRRRRWLAALACLLVAGAGTLALRPAPAPGPLLYLHLRVAPYVGGSYKDIQYWIDATHGRVRYEEAMPSGGPVTAASALPMTRVYVTLHRQILGRCGVTDSDLLDGLERFDDFPCAALLALRDVRGLDAQAQALRRRYGTQASRGGQPLRVPLPVGVDPLPLVVDRHNMRYGYESYAPGLLTLDRATGRPLSVSGYRRDGATLTTTILAARDLPPTAVPPAFFNARPLAPQFTAWLRKTFH